MNTEPQSDSARAAPLLEVDALSVGFGQSGQQVHAVRSVSLVAHPGDRIAIIGESGSGKTMTTLAMLGLLPAGANVGGTLRINGEEYQPQDKAAVNRLVRRNLAAVFQDSLSGLNPIKKIGNQLVEVGLLRGKSRRAARTEMITALERVGISDARLRAKRYPHQLSGGMRQRVMIAMALLASPKLLIADEPTTALDTLVQAQVVDLILELQRESGSALVLITHDIALAADVCQDAVVMYAGYVMEKVKMSALLEQPGHPYTAALLGSMPRLDSARDELLTAIAGETPSAYTTPRGCPFAPRCKFAQDVCRETLPELRPSPTGGLTRCLRIDEISEQLSRSEELS